MKDFRQNAISAESMSKHNTAKNANNRNLTGLHIVPKHTGKMSDQVVNGELLTMNSLSTSVLLNRRCQDRIAAAIANDDFSNICIHCFGSAMLCAGGTKADGMARNCANNYHIMNEYVLEWDKVKVIHSTYFRFESTGDFDSAIAVLNACIICEKALANGSETHFAMWTKNLDFCETVFNTWNIRKPANLSIIYSSSHLNRQAVVDTEKDWFVDGVFTVYEKEYANEHGVQLTCCTGDKKADRSKRCVTCAVCYNLTFNNSDTLVYINEALKPNT